ncbi:MAG: flagellar biosynthesis anti-sigma factor FlgM [Rhodocyclaceae bacterium]|nr:flagellar biosynthesis anti-sigma factor FlgM [Rhodocyclaceae bacterium]
MSISKLNGLAPTTLFDKASKVALEKSKAAPQESNVASESAVKLSPLSEQLKALSKDYAATTAFDEKRVEALRAALDNGTFRVNAEAVADKLIAEAKQLASTKPS